jgi:glycosyltransferase involved in cell wall biosynthesis
MTRGDSRRRKKSRLGLDLTSFWTGNSRRRKRRSELDQLSPQLRADLLRSGLFDAEWYLDTYADVAEAGADPLRHYFQVGAAETRRPNPCFDTAWYLRTHPDVVEARANPLSHYRLWGEREGRSPNPYFETKWYREAYKEEIGSDGPLAHYLKNRHTRRFSPNHVFDIEYYLREHPDVAAAEIEPFEHFISTGHKEGRNPNPGFDIRYYRQKYLRNDPRDPLVHYFEVGRVAGLSTQPDTNQTQPDEIKRFTAKSDYFEELDLTIADQLPKRAKVIAFYLPQFHALPENDRWWGKGFTEWTNVMRGTPRFAGHYQPRIPRDFGFYDLSTPGQLARQMDAAKRSGIHGFCFYYYNFNGTRLLEKPIDDFLADKDTDFPFCLIWANENWTRRWDGEEAEILMRQDYSADDAVRLVDDVARHFKDKRYIRVAGRPMFFVYRPDVIPNPRLAVDEWRRLFLQRHDERPWIFMAQSFANIDPEPFGFDGAVEFPPHKIVQGVPRANNDMVVFDDRFSANVYRYEDLVASSLSGPAPSFPLFKTVFPSWDNDARRQGHGVTVRDSTPAKYYDWLTATITYARNHLFYDEALVFVNAWNEWAEGAYLEPDVHFGGAYLNQTARAVIGIRPAIAPRKILLIGHDAFPAGSQMLLLNLAQTMKEQFGLDIRILLGSGGALLEAYQDLVPTTVASDPGAIDRAVSELARAGYREAISNTVVSAPFVAALKARDGHVVSLVHELPGIIAERKLIGHANTLTQHASEIVFAAESIRDAFMSVVGDCTAKLSVRPQGSYQKIVRDEGAREEVREELGLPPDSRIVIGLGHGDLRKGVDLFCGAARALADQSPEIVFVWAGDLDPAIKTWIAGPSAPSNVRFLSRRHDVGRLLSAADVFALTSREDPYPTVIMEALSAGLPVLAFAEGGGFVELLEGRGQLGRLIPGFDPIEFSREIVAILESGESRDPLLTEERVNLVAERFAFDDYAFNLIERLDPEMKRVSVIVPNYNYAHYLLERLTSIFGQTYPVFEIIVLDDGSRDESLIRIDEISAAAKRVVKVVPNAVNSGNVFAQWAKGVAMARGDVVWIAEADDIADSQFLEELIRHFTDEETIFAFSDSRAIDANGNLQSASYKDYYARSGEDTLAKDLTSEARDFASAYLSERNLILNVSSVLWRKDCLVRALRWGERELTEYKLAGDWFLYLCACAAGGKVAYCARTLNSHRRHESGVTSSLAGEQHLGEVGQVHAFFNETFGQSETRRLEQEAYRDELSEQFGVSNSLKRTGTD